MTARKIRFFPNDCAVRRIGEGLLGCTLPRADWTHEAHLAACLWIVRDRPDIDPARDLRTIISLHNESVGGVNDDHQGYHETITQCFIRAVSVFLAQAKGASLTDAVNDLLASPYGRRDWPLGYYSRKRLFSSEARRTFIVPDLAPLPEVG